MSSIRSNKSSLLTDIAAKFPLRRLRRSRKDSNNSAISSSHIPYEVHRNTMVPAILTDHSATNKLLEAILESPNGRRSLSRLARTCKAFSEPALNVLWRELDSLVPIIGLFPAKLLRKSRKPGLGLAKTPVEGDWKKVLTYGERVRRITYTELSNNVSASIFTIFEQTRPRTYILPHLLELSWKAETAAGLDRCSLFLSPKLKVLELEISTRFPQINAFLTDMSSRIQLTTFSYISPASLPDAFTELLLPQDRLEKVVLMAPGALSPEVGRWTASLPALQNLQLDLTGRSMIAVEGFFDNIRPRSGDSTPSSVGSTDSGVFSGDELDFSDIRKSALRLTGDLRSKGMFARLQQVQLTGEVSNITVFLKQITCPLRRLDLVIEDPPVEVDWHDLSSFISERFGQSLQSLRITATGSSRFTELIRSTSRAEPPSNHLSLEHFKALPNVTRFEIDLPESVIFFNSDIMHLAKMCPNIGILRLCPVARFPTAPKVSLNGLAPLLGYCRRLHTLAIVVNAESGSEDVLSSPLASSPSLLRLHVGHSWIKDPLGATILLSHLTPRLESLKWFHERNRPGFIEANSRGWEKVAEYLPHLQKVRLVERAQAWSQAFAAAALQAEEAAQPSFVPPQTTDRGVNAIPEVQTRDCSVQSTPSLIDRMVQAKPDLLEKFVEARPAAVSFGTQASTSSSHQAVDAAPSTRSTSADAENADTTVPFPSMPKNSTNQASHAFSIPSVYDMLSFVFALFISYPLYIPLRVIKMSLSKLHARREPPATEKGTPESEKIEASQTVSSRSSDSDSDYVISPDQNNHETSPKTDLAENEREVEPSGAPIDILATVQDETRFMREVTRKRADQARANIHASRPLCRPRTLMSDNKKQERDFTPEVDALLPEATSLVQAGKLQDALDKLFALEKQTRNASDQSSTTRLVKAIIEHCYNARDYTLLNSSITLLSKKHGQLKTAVQAMVEQTMDWLEEIKNREGEEKWLELVETLRGVTEGKIFLETPRARVTLLLSHYHETLSQSTTPSPSSPPQKESLQTASDLLFDLQVETYSSMERREKTVFILEQMRLLIAVARQKDSELGKDGKDALGGGEAEWAKVRVCGRKINEQFLKTKENEDLKLKYYDLMIQHALQQTEYLDVAKYYHKVWETPSIKEDENDKGKAALEHIVYYVVLAPHNNEQSDMLHRLFVDPALMKLELQYNLAKCFVTRELMRWPGIEAIYGPFLRTTPVFSSDKRWEDLHTRVIEHNVRIVAEYYTRITLTRLTSLLDLTPQQTEDTLSRLVVSGTIWARIDRPAGTVNFRSKRSAEDVMNDWSSDMQKLLGLVEKTWMGMNAAQAAQSRVKV